MHRFFRFLLGLGLVILLLLTGLGAGILLDRQVILPLAPPSAIPADAEGAFSLMGEAWNLIDQIYVDRSAVTAERLGYGAISGMVDSLGDEGHSRFLSPDMVREEALRNQGEFEGIGAYVEMRDGFVTIVSPIDNTPAQRAGLLPGDVILAVDGEDVSGQALNDVVGKVLGPAGTQVTLTILTPSTGATRDVTLTRARVELENVTWHTLPGTSLAHVRISAFSDGVSAALGDALRQIEAQGLTGVVLDLRNNPGGLLSEAIGTAGQFLPPGSPVLQRRDADGNVTTETVPGRSEPTTLPLVVLINEGSASASEIVAGALQDAGRATLLGEQTFGTGTVLQQFDLSDGSALLLATEEWLTPDGRLIWHEGIAPDVPVEQPPDAPILSPRDEGSLTAEALETSGDAPLLAAIAHLQGGDPGRKPGPGQ